MSGAITLSINGRSEPWPIIGGKVDNLPLGSGGKLTSRSMKTKNKLVIESKSAFQQRLQEDLDGRLKVCARACATVHAGSPMKMAPTRARGTGHLAQCRFFQHHRDVNLARDATTAPSARHDRQGLRLASKTSYEAADDSPQ